MRRRLRITISGPMSGLPARNFPAFNAAARLFAREGWFVVNPVDEYKKEFGEGHVGVKTYRDYLRCDLRRIAGVDAIAVLPGWENSRGATLEIAAAIVLGLAFYDAITGSQIAAPAEVLVKPYPKLEKV